MTKSIKDEECIAAIAGTLINIYNGDEFDYKWGHNYFKNERNSIHVGDCTKVPMTCSRCVCDDALEQARGAVAAIELYMSDSYC